VALIVLAAILLITKYFRGFIANISVLLGIIVGFLIALGLGKVDFAGTAQAAWVALVYPLQFGWPTFDPIAIATMCLVMIVVMVESLGMFLALSEITGKPLSQVDLTRGLRTDGLGTLIGGIFNTFPYTSFSQNVGLVGVTGVRSRWVCVAGGAILVALGLFPKMAHVVASVPQFVLGGAGIVMFGMVAATGIKILMSADLRGNRFNLYIVAISLGLGMIPLVAERFFSQMPKELSRCSIAGFSWRPSSRSCSISTSTERRAMRNVTRKQPRGRRTRTDELGKRRMRVWEKRDAGLTHQ